MVLLQYISKRGLHFRLLRHFNQPDGLGDARATIHSICWFNTASIHINVIGP